MSLDPFILPYLRFFWKSLIFRGIFEILGQKERWFYVPVGSGGVISAKRREDAGVLAKTGDF